MTSKSNKRKRKHKTKSKHKKCNNWSNKSLNFNLSKFKLFIFTGINILILFSCFYSKINLTI